MIASAAIETLEVPPASSRRHAPRIGVIYPSGWGNLGDEAILQATFDALRRRWPQADLRAFTLYPARTASNHGVEADYLTGVSLPNFLSLRENVPLLVRATQRLSARTHGLKGLGTVTGIISHLTSAVVFEAAALRNAWRWLQTADLILAAGGGQLDAVWGGAWGQPYALARWAWLARRAGVPFAFLSVGYGGTASGLSRRLIKYAVKRAAYCSVRDEGSRALTLKLGIDRTYAVVPDLAFSLCGKPPLPARRPGYDVAISPMVYMRPDSWPNGSRAQYDRYLELWSDLVTRIVKRGNRVHLFVSDPTDTEAVREVCDRLDFETRASCTIARADSPDALLEFYRGVDFVVSSRLHGVLLAIVAGRPVLALSHERKVQAVMNDAGVSPFCIDLKTADISQVTERLDHLTTQLGVCTNRLAAYAAAARSAVRSQEDLLPNLLRCQ